MMSRGERLSFVEENREHYEGLLDKLETSSLSAVRRAEFAILSANSLLFQATAGWQAIEEVVGVEGISDALKEAGYGTYRQRAGYIERMREKGWDMGFWRGALYPYRATRLTRPVRGLGMCKFSFAACLIDPWQSDVVCLDTHMYQAYRGEVPDMGFWGSRRRYEELEGEVRAEAESLGMPLFGYQWAVWDLQRGEREEHRFLWE